MPGRRFPPQSSEARGAQHRRAAFEGALDGMSYLPSPIKQNPPGAVHGRYLMQFGQDEKVVTSWGRQEVPLSNRATPYSEHVFVCGPLYGRALREGVEWERYSDFQGVAVFDTAGVQPGEVIVVEYARFGAGSAIEPCGIKYPAIVQADSPSLSTPELRAGRFYVNYEVLPVPTGFPNVVVNDDYDNPNNVRAIWGLQYWDELPLMKIVPGIAPGSSYARSLETTPDYLGLPDVIMEVHSPKLIPHWLDATYFETSVWRKQGAVLPTTAAMGSPHVEVLDYDFDWELPGGFGWAGGYLEYIWDHWPDAGHWRIHTYANDNAHVIYRQFTTNIPATATPNDPEPLLYKVRIDCRSKTLLVFIGSETFTFQDDGVWPGDDQMRDQVYKALPDEGYYSMAVTSVNVPRSLECVFDKLTISTDVPYCNWGVEAGICDKPAISSPPADYPQATIPIRMPPTVVGGSDAVFSGGATVTWVGTTNNFSALAGEKFPQAGGVPKAVVHWTDGSSCTALSYWFDWIDEDNPPRQNYWQATINAKALTAGASLTLHLTQEDGTGGDVTFDNIPTTWTKISIPIEFGDIGKWWFDGNPWSVHVSGTVDTSLIVIEGIYPVGSAYSTDWVELGDVTRLITVPRYNVANHAMGVRKWLIDPEFHVYQYEDTMEAMPGLFTSDMSSITTFHTSYNSIDVTERTSHVHLWSLWEPYDYYERQSYEARLIALDGRDLAPGSSVVWSSPGADENWDSVGMQLEAAGSAYGDWYGEFSESDGDPKQAMFFKLTAREHIEQGTGLSVEVPTLSFRVTTSNIANWGSTTPGPRGTPVPEWTARRPHGVESDVISGIKYWYPDEQSMINSGMPNMTQSIPLNVTDREYVANLGSSLEPAVWGTLIGLTPEYQLSAPHAIELNYTPTYHEFQDEYQANILFLGGTFTVTYNAGRAKFLYEVPWQSGCE